MRGSNGAHACGDTDTRLVRVCTNTIGAAAACDDATGGTEASGSAVCPAAGLRESVDLTFGPCGEAYAPLGG